MVNVRIEGLKAIFEVQGADKLWSLTSKLEIPVAHIKEARRAPDKMPGWMDWVHLNGAKIAGAHIPGVIAAGTFYHKDGWVFWDVHHEDKAVEVELHDETYSRLVVEVENPASTIALLNSARK